jgi:arylamine N-acetyltransferase
MSPSRSGADVYTDEQIDAYLSHIALPKAKYVHIAPADASTEAGFGYLSSLQKHQLATVPFENLSLHYSKERIVSLDREDLFDKFVTSKNGRGGYCMENNLFFGTVLKTLGFDVVHTGARVYNLTGNVDGWFVGNVLFTRPNYCIFRSNTQWPSTDKG